MHAQRQSFDASIEDLNEVLIKRQESRHLSVALNLSMNNLSLRGTPLLPTCTKQYAPITNVTLRVRPYYQPFTTWNAPITNLPLRGTPLLPTFGHAVRPYYQPFTTRYAPITNLSLRGTPLLSTFHYVVRSSFPGSTAVDAAAPHG